MDFDPNAPLGGGLGDAFGGKEKWRETIEEICLVLCNTDKNINLSTNILESITTRLDVIEQRNIAFNINAGKIINLLQEIINNQKGQADER